jgi:hypothetical protein
MPDELIAPDSQNSVPADLSPTRGLIPFQPGFDPRRNAGGRPKKKIFTEALEKFAADNPKEVLKIAKAMFAKAKRGSHPHFKEIVDRVEGPVNSAESSGNVNIQIVVDIPRPEIEE